MAAPTRNTAAGGDPAARAQHLISAAYQLPTVGRTTWLREQCRDDDALRREVSWMLEALRAPDDEFLEGRPHVDAHEPIEGDLSVPAPRDYRIVRPLGEGGMGTVYLAERVDGDYTQQVALKFLNAFALVNPAVVSRFVDERRILAQLNHPNIAHLVDGGSLSDGRPFIAMEYVPGVRLDHYADAMRLDLRQRLALFLKVCAGVQYAHQRLVIHRDLKPANILVGEDGEPKLLDFGIARLIDGPDSHQTRTEAGLRMMTLAYASPEQIRGDALGTATDVYSLGVILYELLTGSRPWRDDASAADLARQICDTEPPVPSTQARRTGNARSLDADLDAIVLKTLRKAPGDRYGSVRELADDIRNYLESRPVLARRGHRAYRMRKFVARHRFAVVASLALLTTIVVFAWDRQVQLEATREQRTRAETERAKAEQVSRVLTNVFVSADIENAGAREPTVREVLTRSAARATAQLDDQPDVQAAVLNAIANTMLVLGRRAEARDLAAGVVARLRPYGTEHRLLMAPALIVQAEAARLAGEREEALAFAREAARLSSPATPSSGIALAAAHRAELAVLLDLQRPREELVAAAEASMAALAVAAAPAIEKARTLTALSRAMREKTFYDEAERYARDALALTASLPDDHPVRLAARNALGFALLLGSRVVEAERVIAPVIPSERALVARTGDARQAASTMMSTGTLQYMLGRYALAARTFAAARAMLPDDADAATRARHEQNIASAWFEANDPAAARAASDRLVATAREAGEDSVYYLNALAHHAAVLERDGDLAAADATIRRAIAGMRANPGVGPDDVNIARVKLARIESASGRTADAVRTMRDVVAARAEAAGADSLLAARARITLAEMLLADHRPDEARDELRRAHDAHVAAGEQCAPNAVELRRLWQRHGLSPALPSPPCGEPAGSP